MPPIDTRQNRPPAPIPKELCTDAPQTWNLGPYGRRHASDSRLFKSASGGWPKWDPRAAQANAQNADTPEAGRHAAPSENEIQAIEQARAAREGQRSR